MERGIDDLSAWAILFIEYSAFQCFTHFPLRSISKFHGRPPNSLGVTIHAKKSLFSRGRNLYSYLFSAPGTDYLEGSLERPFFVALPGEVSAFSRDVYTFIMVIL